MLKPKCVWCAVIGAFLFACTASGVAQNTQKKKTVPQPSKTRKITAASPIKGLSEADKKFMKEAATGGAAEIQLGQMAQGKAGDAQVKQFGERMVKDHSKADDELKALAKSQHFALPTQLDPKHKAAKARLDKLSGSKFDQSYMQMMLQDHTQTVAKFQRESEHGQDRTVKDFAKQTLPVLQSHLQEAKSIEAKLKSGAAR